MKKNRRSRKQQKIDSKSYHAMMSNTKADDSASKAFHHKAYTVDGYLSSKGIDVKEALTSGQESS